MYYNLCLDFAVMDSSEEEQLIKSPMLSDTGKWSQGVILVNKRFRQMVYILEDNVRGQVIVCQK